MGMSRWRPQECGRRWDVGKGGSPLSGWGWESRRRPCRSGRQWDVERWESRGGPLSTGPCHVHVGMDALWMWKGGSPRGSSRILEYGGEMGPSPCDVRVHVDAGRMWGFGSPSWSLVLGPRVLATSTLVWTPLGCGQTLSPCHLCHHPPSSSVLPRIHAASTPSWMPRGSQGVCHSATPPTSNWRPCRSGRLLEFRDPMSMCACVHVCVHAPGEVWGAVIYGSRSRTRCWSGSCCEGRPTRTWRRRR